MSGWFYIKHGLLGDETIGPVTSETLLQLAFEGKLDLQTMVSHPLHTKGQWALLERIPPAKKKIEEGVAHRRQLAEEEKKRKSEEVNRRKEEREAEKLRRAAENAEALANSPFAKFLGDGQEPGTVAKVYNRIAQILTSEETVEYIAIAMHMPGFQSPDCVVATDRRFMVVRQKILGRMDFEDHPWLDLHDAKLREGIMSAELSFRTTDGKMVKIDLLPKVQARKIYGLCQQREEHARKMRHDRMLEEKRAGAGGVVVHANIPSNAGTPATTPAPQSDDPVAKLTKLKQMLDAGLIGQAEYDATKNRILSSM